MGPQGEPTIAPEDYGRPWGQEAILRQGPLKLAKPAEADLKRRLPVAGEMADRIRVFDWSRTSLGPIGRWPDALVIALNAILSNQHPMILLWGDDLIHFYNDAAISTLAAGKHPGALGRRADECWSETWSIIGSPIYAAKYGQSSWKEDQFTPIYRNSQVESAWFTSSYSPVHNADGEIDGVLITRLETTGKVVAERAMRQERSRLMATFEQAPALFAVLRGPTHVVEMANPPCLKLMGGREVLGRPLGHILPGRETNELLFLVRQSYANGETARANSFRFVMPGSNTLARQERFLDLVIQPMLEVDGRVSGIIMLGVDFTERKRATEALVESERSAAHILASITDGFLLVDANGVIRQCNPAARAIYREHGLDVDRLIGQQVRSLFPHFNDAVEGRPFRLALEEQRTSSVEHFHESWKRWFAVRYHPTQFGGVAIFFQDITKRKQAEITLADQRERFEFATEAAQIGYWFCDLPFDKLVWDRRVKEHFWLPADADVDIGLFYERLHPEDRDSTRLAMESSIATHTRYDVEYRTVAPDGRQKWIRAIGRTAYDGAGNPLRFDGVTMDITDLRKALDSLEDERRRAIATSSLAAPDV